MTMYLWSDTSNDAPGSIPLFVGCDWSFIISMVPECYPCICVGVPYARLLKRYKTWDFLLMCEWEKKDGSSMSFFPFLYLHRIYWVSRTSHRLPRSVDSQHRYTSLLHVNYHVVGQHCLYIVPHTRYLTA